MNYKIIIERKEPNPNFESELNEWKERNRWNKNVYMEDRLNPDFPHDIIVRNALICELTEEQFKAIKAEVFKTFV